MKPRSARLRLEALDGRDLPSAPAPTFTAAAATSAFSAAAATSASPASPSTVRHYSYIRVAELAYNGLQLGSFEKGLLKNSVDLVIPTTGLLTQIDPIAPTTPQLIYTNVSNIYLDLLTDWLDYADRHGFDREGAFYHVNRATPFTGDSGSSKPVNWFWLIRTGSDAAGWTDETQVSKNRTPAVRFAPAGQSVEIGYPEKFREININLSRPGSGSWGGVLEYATARDSRGRPTGWKPLHVLSDATSGIRRSGTITFDPPSDWRTTSPDGSTPMYYVRFRTTGAGTAPVASWIRGRDYVNANGRGSGTIPAFDASADRNHDGYLSDSEYRYRKPGYNARFAYESRLFYPAYGQMRFATDPADGGFRNWAVDYSRRFLARYPQADGLFLDNSPSRLQVDARALVEPIAKYSDDYASLIGSINSGIGRKMVLANTAGSGASAAPLAKYGISYIDEFALRPLANTWQQFQELADTTADRFRLMGPNGYAILDTYPAGGSPTDPRTQLAALAYYYLLADPDRTFVLFNGGFAPSSPWAQHWTDAVKYNVGRPLGTWSVFAQGKDPERTYLDYKVFERQYANALVLYRPLSYANGRTGTTHDRTATFHVLPGRYRELRADGTLGPVVTSIRLRNGEGAILIRA
jgi:hypothetical protein